MKYEAVIFDLFGTLIDKFSESDYKDMLAQMAGIISIPPADFIKYWYDTFDERGSGFFQDLEANIEYICRELENECDTEKAALAARISREYTAATMKPRPYALEALAYLKEKGYKTALLTNCSAEIPVVWDDTPFAPLIDVTVFSCSAGIRKPDRRIYELAAEKLAGKPEGCLYIGDGDSRELTGAAAAGMNPVLVRDPDEDRGDTHRVGYEGDNWNGPVIASLKEIMEMMK